MKEGGKILADMLEDLKSRIKPGLDIWELETTFRLICKEKNAIPACMGYRAASYPHFPTGLCIGINHQCVHCYPEPGIILKEGDIVTVDAVIKYKGFHVDSAFTKGVGKISDEKQRLVNTSKLALETAINQARPGNTIGHLGNAMQTIAEMSGFNVLRDFTGHSIGRNMHESPYIPCFGEKGAGQKLVPGMTLAIEALICSGAPEVVHPVPNDWQTQMADGKDFAIFEHTILITKNKPEILTKS